MKNKNNLKHKLLYIHLTVHKLDCLGEETVLVPGCPGNWGSVAPARWQKFIKGMTWM